MRLIREFVRGKLSLGKAFWIFGVGANFVLAVLMLAGAQVLGPSVIAVQVLTFIFFVFFIFTWVGQWRCAFNTKYLFLGALLRTWLIAWVLAAIGNTLLPESAETMFGGFIFLGVLFAICYAIFAPFRDFVRLQIYKRQHPD